MTDTLQNKEKIRRGEPITALGITFYPVTMERYEEWLFCRDALCLRQSSLPVRYLPMDFFNAVFSFEIDSAEKGNKAGLFPRLLHCLCLCTGIEPTEENLSKMILPERKSDGRLAVIEIVIQQKTGTHKITAQEFSRTVRPLIAFQNGLSLPDESANPDILKDAEELNRRAAQSSPVKFDVDNLIASVAFQSGLRERDLLMWTIREFENRKQAIDRDKRYIIYTQSEMSGMVTFKKGNPAPSWCFDLEDDTLGTVSLSDVQKNSGGATLKPGASAPMT